MANRGLGTLTLDLVAKIGGFERGMDKAARHADKRMRAIENRAKQFGKAVGAAMAAGVAAGGVAAVAYIRMADEMANLNARLRLATDGQESYNTAQRETFRIAQTTGTAIGSVIDLYARAAQAAEMLGINQAQTARLTETVSKALTISGTQAGQSSAVILQLSQALAAGRVQAEEFNSIIDGAPRIVQAMADKFGIAFGEVKKYVTDGKVSSKDLADALLEASAQIDAEYSTMPLTVGRAIEQVRNSLKLLVGDTDAAEGASSGLADQIAALARLLESQEVKSGFQTMISGLVTIASKAALAATEFANFAKWIGESAARAQGFIAADDVGGVADRLGKINRALRERETLAGRAKQIGGAMSFSIFSPLEDAEQARIAAMSTEALQAEKRKLEGFQKLQQDWAALANRPSFAGVTGSATGSWEGTTTPATATAGGAAASSRDSARMRDEILRSGEAITDMLMRQDDAQLDVVRAEIARKESLGRLMDDMQFEIDLLGMSAIEQEKAIALRYAGVDAMSAEGQAITDLVEKMEGAREARRFIDDIQGAVTDFAADALTGLGSIGDAFEEMADRMKRAAANLLAEKAIEWLFNAIASMFAPQAAPSQAFAGSFGNNTGWLSDGTYGGSGGGMFGTGGGLSVGTGGGQVMGGGMKVVINNNNGSQISAEEKTDGNGMAFLEIAVDKMVGKSLDRGTGAKVLQHSYGLRRAGVARGV